MSTQDLEKIKKTLADVSKEAKQTDATAEALRAALVEAEERVRQLKERSDRVQRRLAEAAG